MADTVKMPDNAEEAAAMLRVAAHWLAANAPDVLQATLRATDHAMDKAKSERDLFRSLLEEWHEGEYSGGDFLRRVKLALHKGKPRVTLASLRGIAKRAP